jgi:N-acetyl-gamma-glutamyl-phosphate reductase
MRIGIIGASGYTGAELLRILVMHPEAEISYITAKTYAGKKVGELFPNLHPYSSLEFKQFSAGEALREADFFFVALPHGEAMAVVPTLLEGGAKLCDLSADFRLPEREVYEQWYRVEHTASGYLAEAVYGLAELNQQAIGKARLVAVPGCYPTAAILALAPAIKEMATPGSAIIIDAKSGLSGAGRGLSLPTHFSQADENVTAYGIGSHRHTPEIAGVLSGIKGEKADIIFTPHLIPMSRGILTTCYIKVEPGLTAGDVTSRYQAFYAGGEFVVILEESPQTKAVMGSNYCHIACFLNESENMLVAISAIDNLVKGASGQAIQCMNIMNGWNEASGLSSLGIFP